MHPTNETGPASGPVFPHLNVEAEDAHFDYISGILARQIEDGFGTVPVPLFRTEPPAGSDLFSLYLSALPESHQAYCRCNACRNFINRFGGLVYIDESGYQRSILPPLGVPSLVYGPALTAVRTAAERASVTGVFLPTETLWGTPVTGRFHHFSVRCPAHLVYSKKKIHNGRELEAHEVEAEKLENFQMLGRAVQKYPLQLAETALAVIETDVLYRSDKVEGVARWFAGLQTALQTKNQKLRRNILWLAAATAPEGFCNINSTMIGTLLDDIKSGMAFEQVKARFGAKMDPTKYLRPQAAPSAGNIEAAEKTLTLLGGAASLARRYARFEEIPKIWQPKSKTEIKSVGSGIFTSVTPKMNARQVPKNSPIEINGGAITWAKFRRKVLPPADCILYFASMARQPFAAYVTATNPDAPPILRYDHECARNPVSWYTIQGGTTPLQWSLPQRGGFIPVTGIATRPQHFLCPDETDGIIFLLAGASPTEPQSLALFPEILRGEFHAIRSTIEAYSAANRLTGLESASACGIMFGDKSPYKLTLQVWSGNVATNYTLNSWE